MKEYVAMIEQGAAGAADWLAQALNNGERGPDVETACKIVLNHIGEKITSENLKLAAEYIAKTPDVNRSDSERRRYAKKLKKHLHAKRREIKEQSTAVFNEQWGTANAIHIDANLNVYRDNKNGTLCEEHSPTYYMTDIEEVASRLKQGFNLERPQGTSLHHMLEFLTTSNNPAVTEAKVFLERNFQSFVIEHNWAAAFKNVKDFEGGEIKLPFEYTAFEFRVSGIRMIVCLAETSAGIQGMLISGINKRWYVSSSKLTFSDGVINYFGVDAADKDEGILGGILNTLTEQVRAVCIMLDSGVAVGERKAHDPSVNKRRVKQGKRALRDYHVVALTKRYRRESEDAGGHTGTKKRLHWRRGNWAHYKTPGGQVKYINSEGITVSKTWRNWQLVGDESLGFVDKHYSL